MSWSEHHERSWKLASEAEIMTRQNQPDRARVLYMQAAQEEEAAVGCVDKSKSRTLEISVVSAVSLWYKACNFEVALQLANTWLQYRDLADFAREELNELLHAIKQAMKPDHGKQQEIGDSCIKSPVADVSLATQQSSHSVVHFQGEIVAQNFHHRRHYRNTEKKEYQSDYRGIAFFKMSLNEYMHKKSTARCSAKNKRYPKTPSYFCFTNVK
ncbi:MAG: hypothetical protein HQL05_15575 [Nitrospirae bacterium]|uniref:hypothetical protein n=1 Tax=Candidatus Magnetobacterium casense TaxID=1455061 RepID=UPI00058F5003|nr:hypothetical protein [Candidatus Magnetobacterium casensis]MBF0339238.1 hypothetical protein [Nitrospirota bacterium]